MVIVLLFVALLVAPMASPATLAAQVHEQAGSAPATSPDARLELVLGGPHLILYHAGYLALGEAQVTGLQRLRRAVCEAQVVYVERTTAGRDRLSALLADSVSLPRESGAAPTKPLALPDAMNALAAAESSWLTALLRARRDALGLLTTPQRAQLMTLRDHWVRESLAMIEESTRPGQRGHKGTQLPIRVPGMVVGSTTLLPYCESLHGPSMHLSMPGVPPQGSD
ncbi:MAG: hypothetical protein ACK55A_17875 [Gemmatimonas sp.]